jgi:uncharacterized membrane protein YfcA
VLRPESWAFVVAVLAALCFGVSKTAVPSSGALGGALLATVIPARESAGVALPLLIAGDVYALALYGRHLVLPILLRLLPAVAVGLGIGFVLVRYASASTVARIIGLMLLGTAVGELWRRRRRDAVPADAEGRPRGRARRSVTNLAGVSAGASTMVANAGGPVMTLYLLRMNVSVLGFMGTISAFFFLVNVLKMPLSLGLGLITVESLRLDLLLLPGVLAGGVLGKLLLRRLGRGSFELVALIATCLASAWLIVGT